MSFEFQGGFIALTKLQEFGAPKVQAESVAEAIIRHQDPGQTGTISAMGQLIQIATEFGKFTLSNYGMFCMTKTDENETTWVGNPIL
jgi:hypothetical protein